LYVTSPTAQEIGAKNENVWGRTSNKDYKAVPNVRKRIHNQAQQAGAKQFLLHEVQKDRE
jgi:hypothetical protein